MSGAWTMRMNRDHNEHCKKLITEYWLRRSEEFILPAVHVVPVMKQGTLMYYEVASSMKNGQPRKRDAKFAL